MSGDCAIVMLEERVVLGERGVSAEKTAFSWEKINTSPDEMISSWEKRIVSAEERSFSPDERVSSAEEKGFSADETVSFAEENGVSADEMVSFAEERIVSVRTWSSGARRAGFRRRCRSARPSACSAASAHAAPAADLLLLETWNDLGEGTGITRNYDYYWQGNWLTPDAFMNLSPYQIRAPVPARDPAQ